MKISAAALASLQLALAELERSSRQVSVPEGPVDAVSLSTEAVALISAKTQFEAGINLLKTTDLLDKTAESLADR